MKQVGQQRSKQNQPVQPKAEVMEGPRQLRLSAMAHQLNMAPRVQQLAALHPPVVQRAPNRTGLPDALKAGLEALSGMSMDHVRVHHNSPKPAQLHALAYAHGSQIHIAPGQERHLPHEAWHVVQQAQGRVKPNMQMHRGVPVNDDKGLEREADAMGSKAINLGVQLPVSIHSEAAFATATVPEPPPSASVAQLVLVFDVGVLNGEAALRNLANSKPEAQSLQSLITKWSSDAIEHSLGTPERAVVQLSSLVHERQVALDEYARVAARLEAATALHDEFQHHGERNTAMTEALASAYQLQKCMTLLHGKLNYDTSTVGAMRDVVTQLDAVLARRIEAIAHGKGGRLDQIPISIPVKEVPWDGENIDHLRGIKAGLESDDRNTVHKAIGGIRGKDDDTPRQAELGTTRGHSSAHGIASSGDDIDLRSAPLKGAILHRFIADNRRTILDLVQHVDDSVALFSLERGGAFLADLISDFRDRLGLMPLPNVKVPKSSGMRDGGAYLRERHHLALVNKMMETEEGTLFRILKRNPDLLPRAPDITLAIAETAISGSSVNTLLHTLATYHNLLPYSKFRLLVEKQTIKEQRIARGTRGGLRLTDPGIMRDQITVHTVDRVKLFIAHAEYILGEDVGYQISYDAGLAGQPLVIFDERAGTLIAAKLSAAGGLPRDLLRALIGGAFDQALNDIFRT